MRMLCREAQGLLLRLNRCEFDLNLVALAQIGDEGGEIALSQKLAVLLAYALQTHIVISDLRPLDGVDAVDDVIA